MLIPGLIRGPILVLVSRRAESQEQNAITLPNSILFFFVGDWAQRSQLRIRIQPREIIAYLHYTKDPWLEI